MDVPEQPNMLNSHSGEHVLWTTANVSEAAPGVHTPLGWSIWGGLAEGGLAQALVQLGAWPKGYRTPHATDDRFTALFYGRYAANVNMFREFSNRMPGASGDALELHFFGEKISTEKDRAVVNRYPAVLARLPGNIARSPGVVDGRRRAAYRWWTANILDSPPHDLECGLATLRAAADLFTPVFCAHEMVTLLAQAVFDRLAQICCDADLPGLEKSLVGGYGAMEEAGLVADLEAMSEDRLDERTFLRRHGFHGPSEGDVASRSWREWPGPVRVAASARRRTGARALASTERARQARQDAETLLMTALPRWRRPLVRPLLHLTRRYVLARETGKVGFLIAMDGIRAGARGIGQILAGVGVLDDPEDVFFLTLEELLENSRRDRRTEIADRRGNYTRYKALDIPETWRGNPTPYTPSIGRQTPEIQQINGSGVGGAIVRGRVRVVLDTASEEAAAFEPGEILVCRITDPAWTPLLSIAAAAVIDIGGPLSHAAIVARELGIPSVISTKNGSRILRTGDEVEVDGSKGIVQVIRRFDG